MKLFRYFSYSLLAVLVSVMSSRSQPVAVNDLPRGLKVFVESIRIDPLGKLQPSVRVNFIDSYTVYIGIDYDIPDSLAQDDWKVSLKPAFSPGFFWSPHLTPANNYIVAQHVFRSPALVVADKDRRVALIPDLSLMQKEPGYDWYLDLNAQTNNLNIGISKSRVKEHVLFVKEKGQVFHSPTFKFGFFLLLDKDPADLADPWRKPLDFLWKRWGKSLFESGEPIKGNLAPYITHTYNWAFSDWRKAVWQEFDLQGKRVGAPVFIVNVTQSPNYPGPVDEREFRSIWNQAWFSSLRSAEGLFRYARRMHNDSLRKKAIMTKELALAFPQKRGLFKSVIGTRMFEVEENGKKLNRSAGWQTYYFGNSDRNPLEKGGDAPEAPYHLLDMSWTSWLMLNWYEELEKDQRLVDYAQRYGDRLISLQDSKGFFPAWLDTLTEKPLGVLDQSPETSMSAVFLMKLYSITRAKKYQGPALKALDAVIENIIPSGKWEDFETYWSCSRVFDSLVDKQIARNHQYKQNTLSMYWTALALYDAYKMTSEKKYLSNGQRVLDELLMYQASWQPPFIAIPALGGFGVMNADGEWNDSRQSLFAELIIQYGKLLNNQEYVQRGLAALKASFVMMYCPENANTRIQWEKVYPFFNARDYGFMMENYGHGGRTNNQGLGIGEFTIYDWGNGAASEAYNRILDHFGADLIK